jgi:hypothetical protein
MPTITENDIEPRFERFERFGSEHTPAVPLVSGQASQDRSKRYLPTPTDAIVGHTVKSEGA